MGAPKHLNTYNHLIQAINENGQTYNTDYQYYIKVRGFLIIHLYIITQSEKQQFFIKK
jgi:hypothetical protein